MPDPSRRITDLLPIDIADLCVELAQELDDKTGDIKKLAYDISTKLKSLILPRERNTTSFPFSLLLELEHAQEQQPDQEKTNTQGRIKESQIFVVTRRFRDVMNQYNQQFILHRGKCKNAISHELEICESRMHMLRHFPRRSLAS